MRISYKQPVRGKKELICQGDEATVKRIMDGRHAGLVERTQRFTGYRAIREFSFVLDLSKTFYGYSSRNLPYHLMKFLSLALARSMFPDNFVPLREIRFFRKGGDNLAATYSDYVPDTSGVIGRRGRSMDMFYNSGSPRKKEEVRKTADSLERSMNPQLGPAIEAVFEAGIMIAHPEANYHLSKTGRPVFFEAERLDLGRCIESAFRSIPEKEHAKKYVSLIYSVALKLANLLLISKGIHEGNALSFRDLPLADLYGMVFALFKNERTARSVLDCSIGDTIRSGAEYWTSISRYYDPKQDPGPLPCQFDPNFLRFFNHGTGRLLSISGF